MRKSPAALVKEAASGARRQRRPECRVGRVGGSTGAEAANVEACGDSCKGSPTAMAERLERPGRGDT